MTIALHTDNAWPRLRAASRANKRPAFAAVAYVSEGARGQIHLPPGSRLVVDAGVDSVKSGRTCPQVLLELVQRGVRVYNVQNLHAKVYVFGRLAFVGSANLSRMSAEQLVEAVVATSDPRMVSSGREFVRSLCTDPLGPEHLVGLQKLYRPPKGFGSGRGVRKRLRQHPRAQTPVLRIAQLELIKWPSDEKDLHRSGLRAARENREHGRGWEVQSFRIAGKCIICNHEVVVQVIDEGDRRIVEPPGKVLKVARRRTRRGRVAYIYAEVPRVTRRPAVRTLARQLGRGALKQLGRDGLVRDQRFAELLQQYWER
jgi:hypothetical protein